MHSQAPRIPKSLHRIVVSIYVVLLESVPLLLFQVCGWVMLHLLGPKVARECQETSGRPCPESRGHLRELLSTAQFRLRSAQAGSGVAQAYSRSKIKKGNSSSRDWGHDLIYLYYDPKTSALAPFT